MSSWQYSQMAMFQALAEPHRRAIVGLLAERERTAGEIVAALPLTQPTVSKHLRVLREAGLVAVRAEANRRIYRLRTEPLRDLDTWLATFRPLWSARLDALEQHLDDMHDTADPDDMEERHERQ
jgi:DNA-binding transcriptional ArsR family regulator